MVVLGTVFAAIRGIGLTEAAAVSRGFQGSIFVAAGVCVMTALVVAVVMPRGVPALGTPESRSPA